jgi:hypothetical protein
MEGKTATILKPSYCVKVVKPGLFNRMSIAYFGLKEKELIKEGVMLKYFLKKFHKKFDTLFLLLVNHTTMKQEITRN